MRKITGMVTTLCVLCLLFSACTACPEVAGAPAPTSAVATLGSSAYTPMIEVEYVEVTRIVTAAPTSTRAPTATSTSIATPAPDEVQACFNQAMTQGALNGCAALASALAEEELDATLARISLPAEDQEALQQMALNWKDQAWEECEFLYGKTITDESGHSYYAGGSMAPMQWGLCVADRLQQHIDELTYAYLTND